MIQDVYVRIYNILHNNALSLIIAYLFNILYRIKYFLKKMIRKKEYVNMNYDTAYQKISSIYPQKNNEIQIINQPISNFIDLSIIVPVYNYENGIEKNILSCINQNTKYNYEVIFVNDGSTDCSLELLKKYENNSKVTIINKKNGGAASARNVGLNYANGKYVMFVDCDDLLDENIVNKLLESALKNDRDIVMCAHNLVKTQNGKIVSVTPYRYPAINLLKYKNSKLIMNYPGFPWGKVYKRDMFCNIRFPEGYWYEDTITLFLLFSKCNSFEYIDLPLYNYYIHENNITKTVSNTTNLQVIDRYWILIAIIKDYIKNEGAIDGQFYELLLKHTSLFYYNNIKNLDDDIVCALFILAKELVIKYKPKENVKLSYIFKEVEESFFNNDISLWKLVSVYQ